MKRVYNRLTNQFEDFNNQEFYLEVKKDLERDDEMNVVFLHDDLWGELALNSENDDDNIEAVKLFNKEDRNFVKYLDFFGNDNPQSMTEILDFK